jgi:hypothetical protein
MWNKVFARFCVNVMVLKALFKRYSFYAILAMKRMFNVVEKVRLIIDISMGRKTKKELADEERRLRKNDSQQRIRNEVREEKLSAGELKVR